jgi:hypothetical protein
MEEYGTGIICDTNQQLNFTSIFSKVSKDELAVEETYSFMLINSSKLIHIPENAFGKIKFIIITIYESCSLLERIHPNAFAYQSKTTRALVIEARNVIPDKSEPNFFYDLVNSFENLENLAYSSQIGTLEEKFGKNLNNLISLALRVDAIKGSPFSNMSKIRILGLNYGKLNYVSKNGLKIGNSSESWMGIALLESKLNGSSFEKGVFTSNSLQKVKVSLTLSGNQINYLDEAVFMPFLTSENGNQLYIIEPLDCSDCRSAWICKSNKSSEIREAFNHDLNYAKCVDGRDITDCSNNFLKCKSKYE